MHNCMLRAFMNIANMRSDVVLFLIDRQLLMLHFVICLQKGGLLHLVAIPLL